MTLLRNERGRLLTALAYGRDHPLMMSLEVKQRLQHTRVRFSSLYRVLMSTDTVDEFLEKFRKFLDQLLEPGDQQGSPDDRLAIRTYFYGLYARAVHIKESWEADTYL